MTNLINGLWQGISLVAIVWVALKIIPWLNAATRYAIWWLTLLTILILPFAPAFDGKTSRSAEVFTPARTPFVNPPLAPFAEFRVAPASPALEVTGAVSLPAAPKESSSLLPIRISTRYLVIGIAILWTTISAVLLVRLAMAYRVLLDLKSSAEPAPENLVSRLEAVFRRSGSERRPRLMVSSRVASPMALGLADPVILLPDTFPEKMSDSDFQHIALHELAHLRRYDDWLNLLQQALAILLPIQPAIFWIGRELALERETACDDWVIAATGNSAPYAASLTRIAELSLWSRCGVLAAGAAGNPSQLYLRIKRLLKNRRQVRPRISTSGVALAIIVMAFLAWCALTSPRMIALADPPPTTQKALAAPDGDNMQNPHAPSTPSFSAMSDSPLPPGVIIQNFNVQPGDTLTMDVDFGNVEFKSGNDNTIRIVVTMSAPNLAEFQKHHPVVLRQQGREVQIRSGDGATVPRGARIDYAISLPKNLVTHVKNGAGNMSLADITGTIDLNAGAGNVEASNCSGELQLITSSGNISAEKITGAAKCRTGDGNIATADCAATFDLGTGNGNIKMNGFTGPSIHADTGAGNIAGDILGPIKADSRIDAGMGNIDLSIASSVAVNLAYSTGSGNAHSDFRAGAVNGGGPTLRIDSGDGNINIVKK